jgi:hypothetical protein
MLLIGLVQKYYATVSIHLLVEKKGWVKWNKFTLIGLKLQATLKKGSNKERSRNNVQARQAAAEACAC